MPESYLVEESSDVQGNKRCNYLSAFWNKYVCNMVRVTWPMWKVNWAESLQRGPFSFSFHDANVYNKR